MTEEETPEKQMDDDRFYIDKLSYETIQQLNVLVKQLGMTRKEFLLKSLELMGAALDAEAEPEEPAEEEPDIIFQHSFNIGLDLTVTSEGDLKLTSENILEILRNAAVASRPPESHKPSVFGLEFKMPTMEDFIKRMESIIEDDKKLLAELPSDAPDHVREVHEAQLALHIAHLKQLRIQSEEKAKAEVDPDPNNEMAPPEH